VAETSPRRIDCCRSKVDVITSLTGTTAASHSVLSHLPNLLAICTLPPWPALNGYSLRVSRLLDHLAKYWSISLIAPPSDAIPSTIAHHVPLTLPAHGVTYPWRFDQGTLRATVDRRVRDLRPDRALVWAGAEALWFDRPDMPRAVVDVIDCNPLEFWRGFVSYRDLRQRYRALREVAVAARYVRRTVRSYAATVCVGEADARWLRRIGGRDTVHVVPNGVDIPLLDSIALEADVPTLSFTGALDYQPNIEAVLYAANAIWPRIHAALPLARFVIAGRNPASEVSALAGHSNIDIAPDVPDMVREIGRSWVSIAPMRSGVGIKNKVLEAWACARPVVLSRLATNGLIVPADHARLVGTNADAMAASVLALFNDADRRHRLGHSARDNVQTHFTWAGAAAHVNALLRQ
jgi:glycosyltransferase involved in cell wall biosynthesis